MCRWSCYLQPSGEHSRIWCPICLRVEKYDAPRQQQTETLYYARALKSLSRGRVDEKECVHTMCVCFSTSELAQTKHWTWAGINFLTSSHSRAQTHRRYLITALGMSENVYEMLLCNIPEERIRRRGCMKYAKISICKLARDHINSAERSERDPLGERDCEMRRFLIYYLTRRARGKWWEKRLALFSHFAQKALPADLHFIVECL